MNRLLLNNSTPSCCVAAGILAQRRAQGGGGGMGRYHPSRIQATRRDERKSGARGRGRDSGGPNDGGRPNHGTSSVTDERGEVLMHHNTYSPSTPIYNDFKDDPPRSTRGRGGVGRGGPHQKRPPPSGPAEVSATTEKRVPQHQPSGGGDGGRKRSMSQMLLEEFDREPNSWGGMKGGSGGTSNVRQPTMSERRRKEEFEIYEQQRLAEEQQQRGVDGGGGGDGDLVPVVGGGESTAAEAILDHRNIGIREIPAAANRGGANAALLSPATKLVADRAVIAFNVATVVLQTAYCCVEASLTFKRDDAVSNSTPIPIFTDSHEVDTFVIDTTTTTTVTAMTISRVGRVALSIPFIVEALEQEHMGVGGDRLVEEVLTTKYLGTPTGGGSGGWYLMRAVSRRGAHLSHSSPHTPWIELGPQLVDLLTDVAIRRNTPAHTTTSPCPTSPSSKALEAILFGNGSSSTTTTTSCGAFTELAYSMLRGSLSSSGSPPIGTAPHVSALYGAYCFMAKMLAHHALVSSYANSKGTSDEDDTLLVSHDGGSDESIFGKAEDAAVLSQLDDILEGAPTPTNTPSSNRAATHRSPSSPSVSLWTATSTPSEILWEMLGERFELEGHVGRDEMLEGVFSRDRPPSVMELRMQMIRSYSHAHGILHRLTSMLSDTTATNTNGGGGIASGTITAVLNIADALGEELERRVVPLLQAFSTTHSAVSTTSANDGLLLTCGVEQYLAHHLFPVRSALVNVWINRLALHIDTHATQTVLPSYQDAPNEVSASHLLTVHTCYQVLLRAAGELSLRNAHRTSTLKTKYWAVSASHQGQSHLIGPGSRSMSTKMSYGKGDARGLGRSASFTAEKDGAVEARLRSEADLDLLKDGTIQSDSAPMTKGSASWSNRSRLVGTKGFVIPNHVLTTLLPFGTPSIGPWSLCGILRAYLCSWSSSSPTPLMIGEGARVPHSQDRYRAHSLLANARIMGDRLAKSIVSQCKLIGTVYALPAVRLQQRSKTVYFSSYNLKKDRDEAQSKTTTSVYTLRISQSLLDLGNMVPLLKRRLEKVRSDAERRFKKREDHMINERAIKKQYEEKRLQAERGSMGDDEDGNGLSWGIKQVQEVLNNMLTAGGDSEGAAAKSDSSQGVMGKMGVRVYFRPNHEVVELIFKILKSVSSQWNTLDDLKRAEADEKLEGLLTSKSLCVLPTNTLRTLPTPNSRNPTPLSSATSTSSSPTTPESLDASICVDYLLALSSALEQELSIAVTSEPKTVPGTTFKVPLDPGLVFEVDNLYLRKLHDQEIRDRAKQVGRASSVLRDDMKKDLQESLMAECGGSDAHRDHLLADTNRATLASKLSRSLPRV